MLKSLPAVIYHTYDNTNFHPLTSWGVRLHITEHSGNLEYMDVVYDAPAIHGTIAGD